MLEKYEIKVLDSKLCSPKLKLEISVWAHDFSSWKMFAYFVHWVGLEDLTTQ